MDFFEPVTALKGIGTKTAKLFRALDIENVGALLYHFPRAYKVYPEPIVQPSDAVGTKIAAEASLTEPAVTRHTAKMDVSIAETSFAQGQKLELIWFRMPYIRNKLTPGKKFVFYGELSRKNKDTYVIQQPEVYTTGEYEALRKSPRPLYSLTKGLSNNTVCKAVSQLLGDKGLTEEYLPENLLKRNGLISYKTAMEQIHQPKDFESLKAARDRLVYDEFFKFFLTREIDSRGSGSIPNRWSFEKKDLYEKTIKKLPFSLTFGQKQTLREIEKDLCGSFVTQRLLQGDVGSGKTIIAFLIMLLAAENGYNCAIMAPTEVLCRQHEKTFNDYIKSFKLPFEAVCLTGQTKASEKRKLYERISKESGLFIIGTHALLNEGLHYNKLALVVTDEQHRFGVRQRKLLSEKGMDPHVIVMSATPIPRTLAMILYGDMRISVIKDVPARRLSIKNALIRKDKRKQGLDFIRKEVLSGRQAYIICPLVEASEKTEAENVTLYVEKVRAYYKGEISVGILHGRMSSAEKEEVMKEFSEGRISVLVSTTVVEVGINVPNATVMMIEDANRFGLAQLHQLRGRVGRGEWQSYCIFVDSSPNGKESERLSVLSRSNDGFYIAGEDLKHRGPGDFYGLRQSGDPNFSLADIYRDADWMKLAARDAKELAGQGQAAPLDEKLARYLAKMNSVVYGNL